MDPAFARMMERKRQQQQQAEDEEWQPAPPSRRQPSPSRNSTPLNTNPVPSIKPAMPIIPQANVSPAVSMHESEPVSFDIADVLDDVLDLQMKFSDDESGTIVAAAPSQDPASRAPRAEHVHPFAEISAAYIPSLAPAAAYLDPFAEFQEQSTVGSVPMLYDEIPAGAQPLPPAGGESIQPDSSKVKKKKAQGKAGELATGEETYTKISRSDGSDVPVLVIPTNGSGGANWRKIFETSLLLINFP
jgi:hypothetical protein